MIYLDNAATSYPKPDKVISAVTTALKYIGGNPGRSGHRLSLAAGKMILYTRNKLAEFFNTPDPFEYIFTSNCTESLNLAIRGCLNEGDHVITTAVEHNSVLRVLHALKDKINICIVMPQKNGIISCNDIIRQINDKTRLVIMSHVSNVTGAIQPVDDVCRICRERGILSLIDGAQAVGYLPIDLSELAPDMYAFPGHKGLLGPQGTGGLYLKSTLEIAPLKCGGTGSHSLSLLQPAERPESYESGTLNMPSLCGLAAGINYLIKNKNRIWENERVISNYLLSALSSMEGIILYTSVKPDEHTGVAAFNIGSLESGFIADKLDSEYSICCRSGIHCAPLMHTFFGTTEQGIVRISIGYSTTMQEAETFIKAIENIRNEYMPNQ